MKRNKREHKWNKKKAVRPHAVFGLCAALLAVLLLSACGEKTAETTAAAEQKPAVNAADADGADTWSVFWYLCGSDLESHLGAGTEDLAELLQVSLPSNVKVIIETGGAEEWKREDVAADKLTRFLYDSTGLQKLEEIEEANMGDPETLESFLSYGLENYPADHKMVIFWDHGGGVLGGVSYDERYYMDSLSLPELTAVFDNIAGNDGAADSDGSADNEKTGPCFDIVGFDACLMSTIDTAQTICDEARYMVASQELEPGNGWNYTGIFEAFAENPKLTAEELGVVICDTFMEGCAAHETADEATLSLIDLSKTESLFEAYSELGDALLTESVDDDTIFAATSRAAYDAERYGQNSFDEGFTDMIDLGTMAEKIDYLPKNVTDKLQKTLADSVIYQVKGKYKKYGKGLSVYYPLDGSLRSVMDYESKSSFQSYRNFYHYQVFGDLSEEVRSYLNTRATGLSGTETAGNHSSRSVIKKYGLEAFFTGRRSQFLSDAAEPASGLEIRRDLAMLDRVGVNKEPAEWSGKEEITMELGARGKYLTSVYTYVSCLNPDTGEVIMPGAEPTAHRDYQNGVFKDTVKSEWWHLNGHLVYAMPVEEQEDYVIYSVPILNKGEEQFIHFAVNQTDKSIHILTAHTPLGDGYMPAKKLIKLHEGDEITTRMALGKCDAYGNHILEAYETFELKEEPVITREALPDGIYSVCFGMNDIWTNCEYSVLKGYENAGGKVVQQDVDLTVLGVYELAENAYGGSYHYGGSIGEAYTLPAALERPAANALNDTQELQAVEQTTASQITVSEENAAADQEAFGDAPEQNVPSRSGNVIMAPASSSSYISTNSGSGGGSSSSGSSASNTQSSGQSNPPEVTPAEPEKDSEPGNIDNPAGGGDNSDRDPTNNDPNGNMNGNDPDRNPDGSSDPGTNPDGGGNNSDKDPTNNDPNGNMNGNDPDNNPDGGSDPGTNQDGKNPDGSDNP